MNSVFGPVPVWTGGPVDRTGGPNSSKFFFCAGQLVARPCHKARPPRAILLDRQKKTARQFFFLGLGLGYLALASTLSLSLCLPLSLALSNLFLFSIYPTPNLSFSISLYSITPLIHSLSTLPLISLALSLNLFL